MAPHLARLLALPESVSGAAADPAADGVAYLAPSLAFNLGLTLHLWPLLELPADGADGSTADSRVRSRGGAPDRVRIQRYAQLPAVQQADPQQQWHRMEQPGVEAAAVPVAAEAHIAIVRVPVAAVLQQRAKQPAGQERQQSGREDGDLASADGEGLPTGASDATAAARDQAAGPAASDDAVAALQHWLMHARRVVCSGDVLAVPKLPPGTGSGSHLLPQLLPNLHMPQPHAAAVAAPPAAAVVPPELLYFKVAQLVLPQQAPDAQQAAPAAATPAAIDVGSTAVKLVGSCSSGLPVGLQHYLAAAAPGRVPSTCCSSFSDVVGATAAAASAAAPVLPPAGPLLPAWRQLAQLLASALHPASAVVPLRLAVLLHGPSGSGKRTAAAAAAAAVGCHAVSLSCHDVKAAAGAAERHTFEGVRAAFGTAADYAPAVLLLRELSVLGDASSHGGSASAQSYTARLGSVLADCIRAHCSSSTQQQRGQPLFPAPVILVACATSPDDLPPPLRRCFTHELAVEAPTQLQRGALLHGSLGGVAAAPGWAAPAAAAAGDGIATVAAALDSSSLEDTARHTAGLMPRELMAVAADAAAAAALQALQPAAVLAVAAGAGGSVARADGAAIDGEDRLQDGAAPPALTEQHLAAAVEAVRQRTATDIGGRGQRLAALL